MFPLMPNSAHFKSQLDVAFIGGAANGGNTNTYTFNAIGNAPENPRNRFFIVAVARKGSPRLLTSLKVNGDATAEIYQFTPSVNHDVFFAVLRNRPLTGAISVEAGFDGTCNSCVVSVWCVDGLIGSDPPVRADDGWTTGYRPASIDLATPAGGVSFFAFAEQRTGNMDGLISNTAQSYRVHGLEGDQSYYFSLVDNSRGEVATAGPQASYYSVFPGARLAGIAFGPPWG